MTKAGKEVYVPAQLMATACNISNGTRDPTQGNQTNCFDGDKISEGFLSHVPLSVGCIELTGEGNVSFQSDSKAIFTTSLFYHL